MSAQFINEERAQDTSTRNVLLLRRILRALLDETLPRNCRGTEPPRMFSRGDDVVDDVDDDDDDDDDEVTDAGPVGCSLFGQFVVEVWCRVGPGPPHATLSTGADQKMIRGERRRRSCRLPPARDVDAA
jgi:hypothetical protein